MFDPFNNYETEGYLKNFEKEKNLFIVKKLEQAVFNANLGKAMDYIFKCKVIEPKNLLQVHQILFDGLYPWAGLDRQTLEKRKLLPPNLHIHKGNIHFLHPSRILHSLEYTLNRAKSPQLMSKSPGSILGELAYIHPFLDGNGRTLLVVFNELCRRSNFSIDWSKINKTDYLMALTEEIENPSKNILNAYLLQFKTQ